VSVNEIEEYGPPLVLAEFWRFTVVSEFEGQMNGS
jgi:hypothetical protein